MQSVQNSVLPRTASSLPGTTTSIVPSQDSKLPLPRCVVTFIIQIFFYLEKTLVMV